MIVTPLQLRAHGVGAADDYDDDEYDGGENSSDALGSSTELSQPPIMVAPFHAPFDLSSVVVVVVYFYLAAKKVSTSLCEPQTLAMLRLMRLVVQRLCVSQANSFNNKHSIAERMCNSMSTTM